MATQLRKAPGSGDLYSVMELILDRGLVIDAYVRVSLVGIELLTIDLRVVVASVDTFIRYAEAMERLGWHERERSPSAGLPDMLGDGMTSHAVNRGSQRLAGAISGDRSSNGRSGGGRSTSAMEVAGKAAKEGLSRLKDSFTEDSSDPGDDVQDDDDERQEMRAAPRAARDRNGAENHRRPKRRGVGNDGAGVKPQQEMPRRKEVRAH